MEGGIGVRVRGWEEGKSKGEGRERWGNRERSGESMSRWVEE